MKNVLTKLGVIQDKLKVPKNQKNKFGNYNFRSAEDILEAIKPILKETGTTLVVAEELRTIEGNTYVESTIILSDISSGESTKTKASALVDFQAKGMQMPQRTGAASSYAKKYSLGNLFLIDDTQDADAVNDHGTTEKTTTKTPAATPAVKPSLTVKQKDNFLKGIKEGKFDLVEKHLGNYKLDAAAKAVKAALKKAKTPAPTKKTK